MKQPIVLRIYKGEQLAGVKQFLDQQVVIGRSPDTQISLPDDNAIALIHASIEERQVNGQTAYFLADLGSETGTYRNGQSVLDAQLQSGDLIQVGGYRLEFFIGVPKPKAAAVETKAAVAPAATPPLVTPPPAAAPFEAVKPPPKSEEPHRYVPPTSPAAAPKPPPVHKEEPKRPSAATSAGVSMGMSAGPSAANVAAVTRPRPQVHRRKDKKSKKTFAPPSAHRDVRDVVKPSKGTVVEVLLAWGERIISTHHFSGSRVVTMGADPTSDIVLPTLSSSLKKISILKIEASRVQVLPAAGMGGELVRGQQTISFQDLSRGGSATVSLEQGEMAILRLDHGLSLVVRYVSDSPKPLMAPLLDLTVSELTGLIMAMAIIAIFWLAMYLYLPPKPLDDESLDDEPMRTALIITRPPPVVVRPPVEEVKPVPTPVATPPPVKSTPTPKKVEEPKPKQQKAQQPKNDPGAASDVAPNKNKTGPKQMTSVKQGGAVKTTNQEGAQMKAPSKDVTKSGVFSVFGGGGRQNELSQGYNGAGELAGMGSVATGKAGQAEDRAGEGIGTPFKDTGVGGTGTSMIGVPGVKTKGRGSGDSGFGTGGLGNRSGVKIVPGGNEESYSTGIDKEAIRRVVMANLRAIRNCYEVELNKNPNLFGKIVLTWDIGERGRVVSAGVKSNDIGGEGGSRVANCVVARLRTWTFPDPPTNEEVRVESYPFFFSN